jgi:hypothetical protein
MVDKGVDKGLTGGLTRRLTRVGNAFYEGIKPNRRGDFSIFGKKYACGDTI